MAEALCVICDQPVKYDDRCACCLAFRRRNGFDRPRSRLHGAVLSDLEEAASRARAGEIAAMRWLMASPAGERPPSLIGVLFQRPAWMAKAACRGADPDLFFPHRGESTEPAKAIGEGCEVRSECLSAALEYPDTQGIWGGLSDRGRRVLRRVAS